MVYYPPEKQFKSRAISDKNIEPSLFKSIGFEKKKLLFKKILIVFSSVFLLVLLSVGYVLYNANSAFDRATGQHNSVLDSFARMLHFNNSIFQILPVEEGEEGTIEKLKNNKLNRLNILLLGIRGARDPHGGLLTDTIMVVSIKPRTGEVALISIPRDLYVKMPNSDYRNKINETYALGIKRKDWKKGLEYSKKTVSDVTGLDIHYAVSVDFKAFKEIIDTLGGVNIMLDKPFSEKNQFAEGVIQLPAGRQIIDGDTALLFVRARFSTSDFDRAKRQQQVLLAIKEKAFSLGVLSNPMKIMSILNSIGNHIRTDAQLWEIQELVVLSRKINSSNVKKKVFDTGRGGLLYASRDNKGSYILLPEGGNFNKIREVSRNIFN